VYGLSVGRRSEFDKDVELLVLRHQLAVLRVLSIPAGLWCSDRALLPAQHGCPGAAATSSASSPVASREYMSVESLA
jgi:hypothetical protein